MLRYGRSVPQEFRSLRQSYPFLNSEDEDFERMINLFEMIVAQYYNDESLIISVGESPAKMVDIQSKFRIWAQKKCDCFYLPVSHSVLHIHDLPTFYKSMAMFKGTDWKLFFDPIIQSNVHQKHIASYKAFLNNRDILDDLVHRLQQHKEIIFVDFLYYGNSFMAFFLFLFLPLMIRLGLDPSGYRFKSVFLIDSGNADHAICDGLRFLLSAYFDKHTEIYLADYFSPEKNGSLISHFFMDNPVRTIQSVQAPLYRFPSRFPVKKKYNVLLLSIYMNIYLNPRLYQKFSF